jgi:hypothetical protein
LTFAPCRMDLEGCKINLWRPYQLVFVEYLHRMCCVTPQAWKNHDALFKPESQQLTIVSDFTIL